MPNEHCDMLTWFSSASPPPRSVLLGLFGIFLFTTPYLNEIASGKPGKIKKHEQHPQTEGQ